MCFLENQASGESFPKKEIEQVYILKENYCPFCRKTIAGPRIALVVHLAMVHTERSLFECSKLLRSSESTKFIVARKKRIDALLTVSE